MPVGPDVFFRCDGGVLGQCVQDFCVAPGVFGGDVSKLGRVFGGDGEFQC